MPLQYTIRIIGQQDGTRWDYGNLDESQYGPFEDVASAESLLQEKRWTKRSGRENEWSAHMARTRVLFARIMPVTEPASFAEKRDLPRARILME